MLKSVLIGFAAIVAVLVAVIASRPTEFRVSRSAEFAASSQTVFEQLNDLHRWNDWSPWARMDPNARYRYEGPESGTGASMTWAGNNEVGEGRMTIVESRPAERVTMRLDFMKPFESTCTTEFALEPRDGKTVLTWTMLGTNNFMAKAVSLFMDCDKMVGGQFEQGLTNLRQIVEQPTQSANQ